MGQTMRVPSNNTTIVELGSWTCVVLHNTVVVRFNDDEIILATGGWDTVTTRARMNQASNQFGLGYRVGRDKGVTYVYNRIGRIELGNGVTIDRKHYANN